MSAKELPFAVARNGFIAAEKSIAAEMFPTHECGNTLALSHNFKLSVLICFPPAMSVLIPSTQPAGPPRPPVRSDSPVLESVSPYPVQPVYGMPSYGESSTQMPFYGAPASQMPSYHQSPPQSQPLDMPQAWNPPYPPAELPSSHYPRPSSPQVDVREPPRSLLLVTSATQQKKHHLTVHHPRGYLGWDDRDLFQGLRGAYDTKLRSVWERCFSLKGLKLIRLLEVIHVFYFHDQKPLMKNQTLTTTVHHKHASCRGRDGGIRPPGNHALLPGPIRAARKSRMDSLDFRAEGNAEYQVRARVRVWLGAVEGPHCRRNSVDGERFDGCPLERVWREHPEWNRCWVVYVGCPGRLVFGPC